MDVAGPVALLGKGSVGLSSKVEVDVEEVGGLEVDSAHDLEALLPEDGGDLLSHHLQGSAFQVGGSKEILGFGIQDPRILSPWIKRRPFWHPSS